MGKPRLLDIAGEGQSVPSAIFYSSEDNEVTFGKAAINNYTQGVEGRLLRSLKSVLGTNLLKEKTVIRNKRMAFTDIIGDFFNFLQGQLEEQGQGMTDYVVLGRPVHFVDNDEQRDRDAQSQLRDIATSAGFKHVEFQLEPVAAALNYESTLDREELVVVVDIGGGTADFSVLRLGPSRHTRHDRTEDVLATMGMHIGGTDFDRLLSLHSVMPALGFGSQVKSTDRQVPGSVYFDLATWHRIPLLYNAQTLNQVRQMKLDALDAHLIESLLTVVENRLGHALARSVELAKIELSSVEYTRVQLAISQLANQNTMNNFLVDNKVSRTDLDASIQDAVMQLRSCLQAGIADAGVKTTDIMSVFYTGGSSRVPCLRSMYEEFLPHAAHKHGDVFGSVGLGLTIDAARRF